MLRRSIGIIALALLCCFTSTVYGVRGQATVSSAVADGYIIKFKQTASRAVQSNALRTAGVRAVEQFALVKGLTHAQTLAGQGANNALSILNQNPAIEYIEPNYLVSIAQVPNDPQFSQQYALDNQGQMGGLVNADIDATLAWDIHTGNDVIIAIIDSGVDYNHPDLAANIWVNSNEIPGNGFDDDNNGFVDDVRGWDFANNNNDPADDHGHGTHVSGIVGAIGNNGTGIAGVNWKVKLMPLKFIDVTGIGSTVDAIRAINYAVANGARISNNSWGGAGYSQALFDTINAAAQMGHLVVAAAGNDGRNNDDPANAHYPSGYDLTNIISVAATDNLDNLASFSNFGQINVDLGAPGVRILSTLPNNNYQMMDGTSMAAPMVAGVAGLILSRVPNISVETLRTAILNNTDPLASLSGVTATGGRLNALKAISSITADIKILPNSATIGVNDTINFTAQGGVPPYSWSTSNPSVAQIDNSGFFLATNPGTVQITVRDNNGFTSNSGDIVISSINIAPNIAELVVGQSVQFQANGGIVPYTWSTPANGIGNINATTGLFSGLSAGVTEVSVRDANGISKTSGAIRVVAAQALVLSPMRADLMPGEFLEFQVSGGFAPYSWSVSDRTIASINNTGLLTALTLGSVTVTATDSMGSSVTSNAINISELTVTASSHSVRINETLPLSVNGGTPPFQWRVSNSNIASIDTSGNLTAVNPGSIRVTIMDSNGVIGRSEVILVTESTALGLFIRDSILAVNASSTIKTSGGIPPYQWSNSNPSVIELNKTSGTIKGLAAGTSTITVTDSIGETVASDLLEVRQISLSPSTASVSIGQTQAFVASGGVGPYRWQSSNNTVASIDANGLLNASTAGVTTITATDLDGISGSLTLNVFDATSGANHTMTIRPDTATLSRRSTNVLQFTVSGGLPPYQFSLTNPIGSIDNQTGAYSPLSDIAGETRIIVTDADGHIVESGLIFVQ